MWINDVVDLKLVKSDILKTPADVIVTSNNEDLSDDKGLNMRLAYKGG